ncbi:MAG: LLM class flavin-dependent oxidoreductase [Intrasporangium sp.]|uniref:LLM class flavin-dependent oxidoreductase n=1 Tax=Intrasporangium sp. TaxID=1925024 RepID=UPI00264982B2|nr:LLM class flavin-dependent oxidoreductase [Intrasporangium sp.]MDN5796125.1 LLM class flavin-dependent oxidoreductase [Intrasporangium sp.]
MRFGVTILPEHRWSDAAPLWRAAEGLGFDHAWTFDHITWGGLPDSPWYAALPTLTAAAAVTSRIGLGTFVSTPNNHEPVQFMREVYALDDISGGRFLLGIGAGGDLDAGILGQQLTVRQRADRFVEFVRLLDRLSREDRVTADGAWYRPREVRTAAGPVRGTAAGPHVPFLVAANGPRTIRLAAEVGDGWITAGGPGEGSMPEWWRRVSDAGHRLDDALSARGRERHTLRRVLNLDDLPSYALVGVTAFEEAVGRAAALGFTDVVVPWPRATEPFRGEIATAEAVAAEVLPRWRS